MADTALFTVAEARAFDNGQLSVQADFPDAIITAAEVRIREWFQRVCGVAFVSTEVTETYDGTGDPSLFLKNPKVTAVTYVSINGVELTSDQISQSNYNVGLGLYESGRIQRRSGSFAAGSMNVTVTYKHGYVNVPGPVKRAALLLCVNQVPAMNMPYAADGFDDGNINVNFMRGDGFNENWSAIPEVAAVIRAYSWRGPGVV